MKDTYGFSLLENLDKFPIYQDTVSEEYYSKIVIAINEPKSHISFNERYYIQKIKPFLLINEYTMKLHTPRQRIIQVSLIGLQHIQIKTFYPIMLQSYT